MTDSILIPLALLLMTISLLLSVLPFLPGPLFVWGIAVAYAYLDDFERVSLLAVIVMTVIMIISLTSDLWTPLIGVRMEGGSCLATIGSVIGGVIGTALIPIPILGTLIGLIGGALLVELMRYGELKQGMRAGRVAFKLYLVGMAIEFASSAAIIVIFVASLWLTR